MKIPRHFTGIRIKQQRAVLQSGILYEAERIAGKLPAVFRCDIIPAGEFCFDPKRFHSFQYDLQLPLKTVKSGGSDKCIAHVTKIVEYRAAAGGPTGELATVGFQG